MTRSETTCRYLGEAGLLEVAEVAVGEAAHVHVEAPHVAEHAQIALEHFRLHALLRVQGAACG